MTTTSRLIRIALMGTALAVAGTPLITAAIGEAQAAGVKRDKANKRINARAKARPKVKTSRKVRVRRTANPRRQTLAKSRRVVRKPRPAVTMPKQVVRPTYARPIAKPVTRPAIRPRPFTTKPRPAVTMPKTIITKPRPAVTMPKTIITTQPAKPRPFAATTRPARPAVTTPKQIITPRGVDPTQGRLNQRQQQANQAKYQRCARFSMSVLQGCYSQANGDPQRQASCQRHYRNNVTGCQGLL